MSLTPWAAHYSMMGQTGGVQFVSVNATADGNNVILAGLAGYRLLVLGYMLMATAAGTIAIQDGGGTVRGRIPAAANGGASYVGSLECPAFEIPSGSDLVINNPAGVDTLGHMTVVRMPG